MKKAQAMVEQSQCMEAALIALLTAMILLLSMVIIGRMRKSNYNPLDYATPNWELQLRIGAMTLTQLQWHQKLTLGRHLC